MAQPSLLHRVGLSIYGTRYGVSDVKSSIESAVEYLTANPDEAKYVDSVARATLDDSLRVHVDGADGERITTDMPGAVGGVGEKPSPGWLYRASIASCVASTIGMEAARTGVTLASLSVEVDSESDDRGILGIDESTPPGPISLQVRVRADVTDAGDVDIIEMVQRGARRCPVFDATQRSVDVQLHIERLSAPRDHLRGELRDH